LEGGGKTCTITGLSDLLAECLRPVSSRGGPASSLCKVVTGSQTCVPGGHPQHSRDGGRPWVLPESAAVVVKQQTVR
jgi:hypothetical protein